MERTRLADVLPPGDPRLANYDAAARVDYRDVDGRRGSKKTPGAETTRAYKRWLREFTKWCIDWRYQADLAFLDDRKLADWAKYLRTDQPDRPRYTPSSIRQALSAMRYWAKKHEVDPMPSFDEAYGVLHDYMDFLVKKKIIESRSDTRIRPPQQDS